MEKLQKTLIINTKWRNFFIWRSFGNNQSSRRKMKWNFQYELEFEFGMNQTYFSNENDFTLLFCVLQLDHFLYVSTGSKICIWYSKEIFINFRNEKLFPSLVEKCVIVWVVWSSISAGLDWRLPFYFGKLKSGNHATLFR